MHKTKKILKYTVIFEEAREGGYVVRIPVLGCVTEGETFEEAKKMAKDAIKCYCKKRKRGQIYFLDFLTIL